MVRLQSERLAESLAGLVRRRSSQGRRRPSSKKAGARVRGLRGHPELGLEQRQRGANGFFGVKRRAPGNGRDRAGNGVGSAVLRERPGTSRLTTSSRMASSVRARERPMRSPPAALSARRRASAIMGSMSGNHGAARPAGFRGARAPWPEPWTARRAERLGRRGRFLGGARRGFRCDRGYTTHGAARSCALGFLPLSDPRVFGDQIVGVELRGIVRHGRHDLDLTWYSRRCQRAPPLNDCAIQRKVRGGCLAEKA